MQVREERQALAEPPVLLGDRLLHLEQQLGGAPDVVDGRRSARRRRRTPRPRSPTRRRRRASTTTSWPRWTSSSAPAGVSATRYSRCLISLATPIRIAAARYRNATCRLASRHRDGSGARQPLDEPPLVGPEATARRRLRPHSRRRAPARRRRRDHEIDPRIREAPLEERLRPGLDAERRAAARAPPAAGPGRSRRAARAAEGPHHDHRDPELLGERQDPRLALALERVERDLHRVEAARRSAALELVEPAARRSA